MWYLPSRTVGRVLALFGLYVISLAAIGTRLAGSGAADGLATTEFAVVTVAFLAMAVYVIVKRPARTP